jgi:hypothetical protein
VSRQRWHAVAALTLSVSISLVIVAAQPIGAPWWYHADADATYTASSLNLAAGEHVVFLGHPGLLLQEVLAGAFLLEYAGTKVTGSDETVREFTDARLLDLDRTRVLFRGLGIGMYLLGAVALCLAAARASRSWLWGAWGGVLWVGAPNLAPMSIQYRPDSIHALLVVCAGVLLGSAATRRSVGALAAAAAVVGLAATMKVHALGLLVPLAAVALLRPPEEVAVRRTLRGWLERLRGHRPVVVGLLALWALAAVVLNRGQAYALRWSDVFGIVALLGGTLAGALLCFRGTRPWARATGVAVTSFCAALALPASLAAHDGIAAVTEIARTATGGGVNSYDGVQSGSVHDLIEPLLRQTTVLYVLAALAALVGWRRDDVRPALWLVSATALGVMALARLGTPHYFVPSFVLCVLGVAWLCSRLPRLVGLALGGALAVWIVGVQFRYREGNTETFEAIREKATPVYVRTIDRLQPGSAILTPSEHLYLPTPDTHYFEFVRPHVVRTPKSEYRSLPATAAGIRHALAGGVETPVYVGPRFRSIDLAARARLVAGEIPAVQRVDPAELRRLAGRAP